MNELIASELNRSASVISRIDPSQIRMVADLMIESISGGGQAIFMGNGGSSADAQHIAAELSGKYSFDRPAMAGVCLSNIAPVTSIGNDYSYDLVFKRQIEATCRPGDIVVGLSTSGNSRNVILAMDEAKRRGAATVSFTGDCGELRNHVDLGVIIPTTETPRVQEGYMVACHSICGIVEREMFGRKAVLIDRDDTIAKDVPYCDSPDKMHLFPGVPESIAKLKDAGYLVIIVTNQSGIGRGLLDAEILLKVHDKMIRDIRAEGGDIDDIFFCPHHPDSNCPCRKPEIGMGEAAILKHHINPKESFMIGDHDKDLEFGRRLGMKVYRVSEERTFNSVVDEILGM